MSKSINELVKESYENAISKGWHEEKRSFGELIALCHSELSEALEEYRNGRGYTEIYYNENKPEKSEGIPIELADTLIRIFDMCGLYEIDIEEAIRIKMEYNTTRPYRHNGKII